VARLHASRGEVTLLTGDDASEERFVRAAIGRHLLHIATHAFFVPKEECEAPDESPLLRAGLVLAGVNASSAGARTDEDGLLTAEELVTLDLSATRLAVLSACEAARGAVHTGEGAFGLRRALELAGVRSVVMSLWPVSDRWARRWMRVFYGALEDGEELDGAVRRAQLANLKRLRLTGQPPHPYRWAGFIAAGEWR
jgi:CHAT domain-containing protein